MKEQTHLKEWHISHTLIGTVPAYIKLFQAMRILDLPKNQLSHLPAEIGTSVGRAWASGSRAAGQPAAGQAVLCVPRAAWSQCPLRVVTLRSGLCGSAHTTDLGRVLRIQKAHE